MDIHSGAKRAIERLEACGYKAYLVGGCVRDSLMGRTPHDWDVCTSARPDEVAACFSGEPVINTGLQHGTVTVILDTLPIEITTFRIDGTYDDNRHPSSVAFVRSLRDDLMRRDFTINALAYHPVRGVIDYVGGAADIEAGVVRCVGDPAQRFREDGLRIMRALRFASQLQFALASETAQAVHDQRALLRHIAAERLRDELCGLLEGALVRNVLLDYPDVLAQLIPELEAMVSFPQRNPYHDYDVWQHTAHSVAAVAPDRVLRLTMLLHDIGKPRTHTVGDSGVDHFYGHPTVSADIARDVLRRLRFDNETRDTVVCLVRHHDVQLTPRAVIRWMNRLGDERFAQLLEVKRADILAQAQARRTESLAALDVIVAQRDDILARRLCFSLRDLALDGRDVIVAGVPPGPAVGRALDALLALVMDGAVENDREALLVALHEMDTQ